MSYGTNRLSRDLDLWLNDLRAEEEQSLSSLPFIATVSKGYKRCFLIMAILFITATLFQIIAIQKDGRNSDFSVTILFGAIGIILVLLLPSLFSYRCYVDRTILRESYYILCFKVRNEVFWNDVAYKVIKRDYEGRITSVRLYDIEREKLISFDNMIVGFGKILRMAKNVPGLKR